MGLSFDKLGFFNIPLTVLWYLGIINAMNLIDGLDGLAGGIAVISGAAFMVLGLTTGNTLLFVASLIICAGSLGFLVFNFHPAKIFMGDTGSLALGYLISALGMLAQKHSTSSPFDLVMLILLVFMPSYNVLVCVAKRLMNGISLFTPDNTQTYNLIMRNTGASMRKTVVIYYIINAIMAASAFAYIGLSFEQKLLALVVLVAVCVAITAVMGFTSAAVYNGIDIKTNEEAKSHSIL